LLIFTNANQALKVPLFLNIIPIFIDFFFNRVKASNSLIRLAQALPKSFAMNLYDFLIIYLSCGAPLGVYYFLQNRKTPKFERLRLKTVLNFLFWIPFAYRLLQKSKILQNAFNNIFGSSSVLDAAAEKNIYAIRKRLEKIYLESNLKLSIYEVREILDRYAGLTLECQFEHKFSQTARTKSGIFQITEHKNAELAAICLERRNRKRLLLHQTEARRDFLHLLSELFDSGSDLENLESTAIEFVTHLKDAEARAAIEKMFGFETQTENTPNVKHAETEIWTSETQKPLLTRPASARLKTLTAAMNLRAKD
jgi:hypothetical protein